jgi:hypothetical protein
MKYRIKETINGHGVSRFMIQGKVLWWWKNFTYSGEHSYEEAEVWIKKLQTKEVKYHTVEQ